MKNKEECERLIKEIKGTTCAHPISLGDFHCYRTIFHIQWLKTYCAYHEQKRSYSPFT